MAASEESVQLLKRIIEKQNGTIRELRAVIDLMRVSKTITAKALIDLTLESDNHIKLALFEALLNTLAPFDFMLEIGKDANVQTMLITSQPLNESFRVPFNTSSRMEYKNQVDTAQQRPIVRKPLRLDFDHET